MHPLFPADIVSALQAKFGLTKEQAERIVTEVPQTLSKFIWENNFNDFKPQYEDTLFLKKDDFTKACPRFNTPTHKQLNGFKALQEIRPMVLEIKRGNGLEKTMSEIKLTNLTFDQTEFLLSLAGSATDLEKLIFRDDNNKPINLRKLDNVRWVPINLSSLRAYIEASSKYEDTADRSAKANHNLLVARAIYKIAEKYDGLYPHIIKTSEFGREYYLGMNLQNAPKTVRFAALGKCYSYDLKVAAFSVTLQLAMEIAAGYGHNITQETSRTRDYIDRKDAYRRNIAKHVFADPEAWAVKKYNDQPWELKTEAQRKQCIDKVKRAFTALSFGAKPTAQSYFSNGSWHKAALTEALGSELRANRFLEHEFVAAFVEEQEFIGHYIYTFITQNEDLEEFRETLKQIPEMFEKGKFNRNKLLAYMYQQQERALLDKMTVFAETEYAQRIDCDRMPNVLLRVHDGFITRFKVSAVELRSMLKGSNTWLDVDIEEYKPWTVDTAAEHHALIAREEQKAKRKAAQARSDRIDTTTVVGGDFDADVERNRRVVQLMLESQDGYKGDAEPAIYTDKECYDGSGYSDARYDADLDPYLGDEE